MGRKSQLINDLHYLGGWFSIETKMRLKLIAMLTGKTQQGIIYDLIQEYFKDSLTLNECIYSIAAQIYREWVDYFAENMSKATWNTPARITRHWEDFLKKYRKKLNKKRIQITIIDKIIIEVEKIEIENGLSLEEMQEDTQKEK